jgi:hypothetical protein
MLLRRWCAGEPWRLGSAQWPAEDTAAVERSASGTYGWAVAAGSGSTMAAWSYSAAVGCTGLFWVL